MRTRLVVGNWKMQSTASAAEKLARKLATFKPVSSVDVAVCPGFLHLPLVAQILAKSCVELGGQDCATNPGLGALTGEISAHQLKDVGCRYVLIGHSERRLTIGESAGVIAKKFTAAVEAGLTPIVCVGETLEQRRQGMAVEVITGQLDATIKKLGVEGLGGAVVAYEPVWAIGTGVTASAEQAQEMHAAIRSVIVSASVSIGDNIQILYGGSVKATNAADLFSMPDIDGVLVGGAALDADEFLAICAG